MQKGIKKSIIIAVVLVVLLILINVFVFTAKDLFEKLFIDLELKDFDVKIELREDGSAFITETHNAKFKSKDDDWWNYYKVIGNDGEASINIGTLRAKVDGVDYPFEFDNVDFDKSYNKANQGAYLGKSYYCDRGTKGVEIGVVMRAFEKGVKKIEFSYVVENIVKEGSDIASFYYKFISDDNSVPIDNFTATIKFPTNSKDTLRTWMHITGVSGTNKIVDSNTITYKAKNIPDNTFVETRITLDKDNFNTIATNSDSLSSIVAEEQKWFEESKNKAKRYSMFVLIDVVVGLIALGVCLFFGIREFMKRKRVKIDNVPIYLHEPPTDLSMEESMSIFYYYDNDGADEWWSDVISGTILNLVRKKYLTVVQGDKKKGAMLTIVNNDRTGLKPYEDIVMNLLESASVGSTITMKQFENWCKENYVYVSKTLNSYKKSCNARGYQDRMFTHANPKPPVRGVVVSIIGLCMSVLVLFAFNPFYIANMLISIGGIALFMLDRIRSIPLMKGGERKYLELKAFEKFMLDFSTFDRKTLPELALWEEYMVWATGMGIADEVSKQLSITYPEYNEFMNSSASDTFDTFVFWYMFSPSFRFNTAMLTTSLRESVSAVNALKLADSAGKGIKSVGSGFGGGSFSGGGGGFGGGSMGGR